MLKRILLPLVVAVLTAISAAGEDVVPTRDLTCGCQFCEGSGQWQLLNIVRDNLGSVTHVATAGGTLLAEYSYDAWGRLRDPQTLVPYARGQEPDLRLGRGYTGRFLGPDPVMPETGVTQTYNSYTYCLNNPLKYTDPDGKWIHIAIGAAIGGTANLIANWGNCDGFWEYAAAFGIGAATGAVSVVTAGGGTVALLTLGACSGASTAAVNNIISQTDHFKGDISWNSFWNETLIGTVSGLLGSHFGSLASQYAASIGGISISNPMWAGLVNGAEMGAMSGAATGAVMSLITGEDFWRSTFSGALSGGIVGGVSGFANGLVESKKAVVAATPAPEQTMTPQEKGKQGVAKAKEEIEEAGGSIFGYEVSFDVDGKRVRADIVYEIDGNCISEKLKMGNLPIIQRIRGMSIH